MMVKLDVPDFSVPPKRTDHQPPTNKAPSEPRGEAEAPLDHRDLEGLPTRAIVGAPLTALSFPQSGTTTTGAPLVFSVGNRAPGRHPAFPHCRALPRWHTGVPLTGITREIYCTWPLRTREKQRRAWGLQQPACRPWQTHSSWKL